MLSEEALKIDSIIAEVVNEGLFNVNKFKKNNDKDTSVELYVRFDEAEKLLKEVGKLMISKKFKEAYEKTKKLLEVAEKINILNRTKYEEGLNEEELMEWLFGPSKKDKRLVEFRDKAEKNNEGKPINYVDENKKYHDETGNTFGYYYDKIKEDIKKAKQRASKEGIGKISNTISTYNINRMLLSLSNFIAKREQLANRFNTQASSVKTKMFNY
jgi:hypothetical protein